MLSKIITCNTVFYTKLTNTWFYRGRNIRRRNRHHHRIIGYQNDWAQQPFRSSSYSRTWHNNDNDWDTPVTRNVLSDWEDDMTPSPVESVARPSQPKTEVRGVWHSYQAGSARIPHKGASVDVVPNRGRKKVGVKPFYLINNLYLPLLTYQRRKSG